MTLTAIILSTLAAGIGSVWIAELVLRTPWMRSGTKHAQQSLLSMAAGALLATAFMHLLPEAFESELPPEHLFTTLLAGIVFFFLLTKAELWHHGHEHGHTHGHTHGHGHSSHHHHEHEHEHHHQGSGAWSLLTGDSVHCFGDGVLIASAFVADMRLGVIAALSVLAHEVPHHMGDLVVINRSSTKRSSAVMKVSLAGATTALGGLCGYALIGYLEESLAFFLVIACSSFIYVALSDLIPQLQKRLSAKETIVQILWLLLGIGLVSLASHFTHTHAHA